METKTEEVKKSNIGMKVLMGLAILMIGGLAFAGVVSYLSNTAEANVTVSSPMSIQFAEVNFAGDRTEPNIITVVEAEGLNYTDDLSLTAITGLDTIDLGVEVKNLSEVKIENRTLLVTVSNSLNNVDEADITSLQFFDSGASVGSVNRVWQELSSYGTDNGATVTYAIPINSLAAGETYDYPVQMTFGNVAPAVYTITATLMVDAAN